MRRLTASTQDQFAQAIGAAGETLDALEIVQAFGREASGAARFGAAPVIANYLFYPQSPTAISTVVLAAAPAPFTSAPS